jgi:protein-S-isoprenylcysteine O-methyltransferase Ste14
MLEGALFVGLSLLLLVLGWRTLKTPSPRGVLRFLAFEASLGLTVLAARTWFLDALSWRQIASWVLLAASLALAVQAIVLLHRFGAPQDGIEGTQQLVERGVYRWIRHPLYFSLVVFGLGAWLKRPEVWGGLILLTLAALVAALARVEEEENLQRFGDAYRAYLGRTWRFIPRVY